MDSLFMMSLVLSFCVVIDSARILGVFPMPLRSHRAVFKKYIEELSKHGHEVIVITPPSTHTDEEYPDTITQIDTEYSIEMFAKDVSFNFKRGMVCDVDCKLDNFKTKCKMSIRGLFKSLMKPKVKELIDNATRFDLVVTETYFSSGLLFSKIFNAPAIQFSTLYPLAENLHTIGALSSHPFFHPSIYRTSFGNLTFFENLFELKLEYNLRNAVLYYVGDYLSTLYKEFYGPSAPTHEEIKANVVMLFTASNHIFDNNRPVPVNFIYTEGLHLAPIEDIPHDLKTFLDSSKCGAVYVSFGSYIRVSKMDKDLLKVFLDAFKMLPYNVLLKSDIIDIDVSENVRIGQWFPQRNLLAHPNIKAFITQGGLQSISEAVDAGVPLVGMPTWADQGYNVNKIIECGIGLKLDPMSVTAEEVVRALSDVIENKSYRNNIHRLRDFILDQPQSSLERAVWWTEYVLRHGGARHLRSPAANMSWSEYLELELMFILGATLTFISLLLLNTVFWVKRRLLG